MATKCPLCRHEFSFAEILRRWNPFGSPCPHCHKPLAMKRSVLLATLFASVVLPIFWFLGPTSSACAVSGRGFEALILEGLKLVVVVVGLAVLAEWIYWKTGWLGYLPAKSTDDKAARFWKLFVVAGLPLGLTLAPTAMLFHWSGVFAKNAEHRLESMPGIIQATKKSKLNLEESRKLILMNLENTQAGFQGKLMVCRALRIQSGLVLVALAWFVFWSYRMIFHPPKSQGWVQPMEKEGRVRLRKSRRKPGGQ